MKSKKQDNFWLIFMTILGTIFFGLISSIIWLKTVYLNAPDNVGLAKALGVDYDPSIDPFKTNQKDIRITLISGYLYQDSMPFGFEDWSWDTITNWRANNDSSSGSYVMRTSFLKPWSGVRVSSPVLDISKYKSIEIKLKPESKVEELYFEFYDKKGNSYGKQALSWYGEKASLQFDSWNTLKLPLSNLLPSEQNTITGFSISSKNSGVILIDSVQLKTDDFAYAKWVDIVSNEVWIGKDPFKGITQIPLPYTENFTLENAKSWRELFGQFSKNQSNYLIGPVPKKTTGSMAVFGGGKDWQDYKVHTTVYWGQASSFAILVRFIDDSNFVSCSYSNYGMLVQIYKVINGKSDLVGQTPPLAIKDYEPWKNVKHDVSVEENTVSCYMDGELVLKSTIEDMPKKGTVGLETWSQNSNDYGHKIESLTVEEI